MLYTRYSLKARLAIYLSLIAVSVNERKLIQELKGLGTRLKRQLPNDEIHRNTLSVAAHIRKHKFNNKPAWLANSKYFFDMTRDSYSGEVMILGCLSTEAQTSGDERNKRATLVVIHTSSLRWITTNANGRYLSSPP